VRFGPVPPERIAGLLTEDGADASLADACARLSGGDVQKARWLAGEGSDQRGEAEAAARATLRDWEDADWTLAEPWRGLLERAAESGARAEAAVNERLEELVENEPKKGRSGFVKEFELQARRAHRRAHTASLDHSLELVQLWFRDLVALASRSEAQVFNTDRLQELAEDAEGRDVDSLIGCVDLCETTRRRLERNVLEDLALEALFNRLRRIAT
jgi:DNA polymerase-3 subunit delta'